MSTPYPVPAHHVGPRGIPGLAPSILNPSPQPGTITHFPFLGKEFSGDEQETNDSGQHLPSTCTKHLAMPFMCFILFNAHNHLGEVGAVLCLYSEKEIKT